MDISSFGFELLGQVADFVFELPKSDFLENPSARGGDILCRDTRNQIADTERPQATLSSQNELPGGGVVESVASATGGIVQVVCISQRNVLLSASAVWQHDRFLKECLTPRKTVRI
jgi:hypothetical protein